MTKREKFFAILATLVDEPKHARLLSADGGTNIHSAFSGVGGEEGPDVGGKMINCAIAVCVMPKSAFI